MHASPSSDSARARRLPTIAFILAGALIGLASFAYQLSLPPLFRGLVCCDASVYATYARMIVRPRGDTSPVTVPKPLRPSPSAAGGVTLPPAARAPRWLQFIHVLFSSTGKYVPGYGFFLAAHIALSNLTGGALPWIESALVTGFLLQIAAISLLWKQLNKTGIATPAWTLALALAHPTLASHAALPISDSLAISLLLFGFALFLGIVDAKPTARSIGLAILTGFLFGAALWVRSIYMIALAGFFALWFVVSVVRVLRRKQTAALVLWTVTAASAVVILLPRLAACYGQGHTLCIVTPKDDRELSAELLTMGFTGARSYTVLRPIAPGAGKLITVTDAFIRSLGCTFDPVEPKAQLAACVLHHWWQMPSFVLVKFIGTMDAPHFSSYVTNGTPPWLRFLLRLWMMPVLAGLLAAAWLAPSLRKHPAWLLVLGCCGLYLATLLPLAIEYRYALLLVPIGLFSLGHLTRAIGTWTWLQRASYLAVFLLVACAFWIKTAQWDHSDPIPYVPIDVGAREDVLKQVMTTLD